MNLDVDDGITSAEFETNEATTVVLSMHYLHDVHLKHQIRDRCGFSLKSVVHSRLTVIMTKWWKLSLLMKNVVITYCKRVMTMLLDVLCVSTFDFCPRCSNLVLGFFCSLTLSRRDCCRLIIRIVLHWHISLQNIFMSTIHKYHSIQWIFPTKLQ